MTIDHNRGETFQGPSQQQATSSAHIKEISLKRLQLNDEIETTKLLIACKEDGVFYLNLRDYENRDGPLLSMSTEIFQLSKELFSLPLNEKMEHDIDKFGSMRVNGYKPIGRNKGGLAGGKDGFESYAISKDFVMSSAAGHPSTHTHPAVITNHTPLLTSFVTEVTAAVHTILGCLSTALDLPPGAGFEAYHRPEDESPSMLRLLRYTEQPPSERGATQNPHTDLGSLTVLFARSPGLQRKKKEEPRRDQQQQQQQQLSRGEEEPGPGGKDDESCAWEFIEPRPHCAIVNVGDVLVALSNGLLHSCLHRVVPLPGRGLEERFSFAWLERPRADTLMTGLGGGQIPGEFFQDGEKKKKKKKNKEEVITSGEWLERKFTVLRK